MFKKIKDKIIISIMEQVHKRMFQVETDLIGQYKIYTDYYNKQNGDLIRRIIPMEEKIKSLCPQIENLESELALLKNPKRKPKKNNPENSI
jgi:hypothetical protein